MAVISNASQHPANVGPAGHEAPGSDDLESLRSILRKRVISIGSMSLRLRLITGFAIGVGIASITATAVQALPVHLPMIELYAVDGRLVEAPALVLILTVAMLIIAWTYLLSGALHAHWSLRIAGIAAFSLAMWSQRSLVAGHGSAYIAALLLGALWLWGLLTLVWDREQGRRGNHEKRHGSRVTWTTFAAVLGIVTGLFVVGFSSASRTGSNLEFTVNLSAQLTLLAVYLVPILLVAGVDFAEWGEILSVRVGRISTRLTSAKLAAAITLVLSVGITIHYVWPVRHDVRIIAETMLVGGVVGGLIVAAVWMSGIAHRARVPAVPAVPAVPVFFVALAAVIYYAVTFLYVYVPPPASATSVGSIDAILGPYSFAGVPSFSLEQPFAWDSVTRHEEGKVGSPFTEVVFSGEKSGDPAIVDVFALPTSISADTTNAASQILQLLAARGPLYGQVAYLASWTGDHGWDRFEVKTTAQIPGTSLDRARLWTRVAGGQVWVLIGITPSGDFAYNSPAFDTMAATWAPHGVAVPTAPSSPPRAPTNADQGITLALGLMLLTAIAGLVLARRGLGGRFSGALSTGSLYLLVASVLSIGMGLGSVVSTLSGSDHEWLSMLHLHGIQLVVGVATVIVVVAAIRQRWRNLRRLIGPLFALNLALIIVALFYQLYTSSGGVAQFTVPQAVVLLVAFALDVVLSGEAITNARSDAFPRHARVMMFFGYILMGSVLVLYFSSLHYQSNGGPVPSQFEGGWPQVGLIIFGIPVVLTIFILKVVRLSEPIDPGHTHEVSDAHEALG